MPGRRQPDKLVDPTGSARWGLSLTSYIVSDAQRYAQAGETTFSDYVRLSAELMPQLASLAVTEQTRIITPSGVRHPMPTVDFAVNRDHTKVRKNIDIAAQTAAQISATISGSGESASGYLDRALTCTNYLGKIGVGHAINIEGLQHNHHNGYLQIILPFSLGEDVPEPYGRYYFAPMDEATDITANLSDDRE